MIYHIFKWFIFSLFLVHVINLYLVDMTIKPIKLLFAPTIVQQPPKLKRPYLMNLFICMIIAQLELTLITKDIQLVVKFEQLHIVHVRNFQWISGLSKVIETRLVGDFYLSNNVCILVLSFKLNLVSQELNHFLPFVHGFSKLILIHQGQFSSNSAQDVRRRRNPETSRNIVFLRKYTIIIFTKD